MGAGNFTIGQRVVWQRIMRGGYGYLRNVPATVVRFTGRKVVIAAELTVGGAKNVAVSPDRLVLP